MNWDQIEGNWKQALGRAKERWGRLSDDHLTEIGGRKDRLVGKIQEIYGATRDDAERQVSEWQLALDEARNPLHGAPGFTEGKPASAADATAEWWNDARRTVARTSDVFCAYVEERPLFVLGCAVGVGLILGLALGRR
jgi:uncharacterized protein YjbJ (UPF0337 family)/ElaB/YqjD/DUF883 family membrane-anchored ribosome-binding protein